ERVPPPVATFGNLVTEGTQLFRLAQYDKALGCFNNALRLRPGDKECLIARAKCYLKIGDTENSLKDAEATLKDDKTFCKGLYQKAETLFIMGDFEFALVFYHRGHSLRPDLPDFRLGIEKSQEAIINCIGSPSSVKLENKEGLCFISRQEESKKANQKFQVKLNRNEKRTKKQKPMKNAKTERQLLGELYVDKAYLEKLLKDKDLMQSSTKEGTKVEDLVLSGISYLEKRGQFWQQQNPIYARVRERRLRQQRWIRDKKHEPSEVARYIMKNMEEIEMLLSGDCPEEGCKKAEHILKTIQGLSDGEVPKKNELIGNLYSCIGTARLEMGRMEAALRSHQKDLELARKNNFRDAVSRALENIGRVYVRMGKFQEAIDTWEEKVPMARSRQEKTWLFHEIGRCYLELNEAEAAQNYGEKSLESAEEEGDVEWQLHAIVLLAQAQVQLQDYWTAIMSLEKALQKAKIIRDEAAQETILTVNDDLSSEETDDKLEEQREQMESKESTEGAREEDAEKQQEHGGDSEAGNKEDASEEKEEGEEADEEQPEPEQQQSSE
ncbi:TTC25 protein, partial [Centropus bengalensis]|nr:TTC25 protein [Centropus bengalensis]